MKRIVPYKTVPGALRALDNGGRFYNVFTKAGDGRITNKELSKAAGVILGRIQMFLYFHLALSHLSRAQQDEVIYRLSPGLRAQYLASLPLRAEIGKFESVARPTQSVVVEGYPCFLENKTQFRAFIMVPIMTGKTMTFSMVPIYDRFDVYELYARSNLEGRRTMVATVRGSKRLKPKRTILGGIVRELKFDSKKKSSHRYYIETLYYIEN